ncbi:MAG: multiheme c-type cytochrome [candidate division Zixibacteria bacterium]|nr:multiheme c-type cytochrome [candidate division Zixibacteria bacterium]
MRNAKLLWLPAAMVLLLAAGCERKVTNQVTYVVPANKAAYVGSNACEACHADIYADFAKTGHPSMLATTDSVQQTGHFPDYVTPLQKPADLGWDEIDRVIGGFWWKANFTDQTTGGIFYGPDRLFNMATETFDDYDGTTPGIEEYSCARCHTTGYVSEGHQQGKENIVGRWTFDGIQCERCHGAGGDHVADPYKAAMTVDRSADLCGGCHSKGDVTTIEVADGFIKDHQQYNEMFATKHLSLECVDCHDPHVSLHPNNPGRAQGLVNKCENCHLDEVQSYARSALPHYQDGVTCIECHMAKAAWSAYASGTYEGDVHSHLMTINTDPTASMIQQGGTTANPYLTVEYTCLKSGCHNPALPENTKAWAASNADQVHPPDVGEAASCFTCHSDDPNSLGGKLLAARQQYDMSAHGTGDTYNENRIGGSQTCEKCHTNEGFVARVTGVPAVGDQFTRISCFTCHQPHTLGTLELRVGNAVTLANGATFDKDNANICASCHQSRRNVATYVTDTVTLSTHWGPHGSPQSDMLIGTNAYEYAGYEYENSPHANVTGHGCLDCHKALSADGTGGHTFYMANEEVGYDNTNGCNVTLCHDDEVADFDYDGKQTEVEGLLSGLETLLINAGLLSWIDQGGEMVLEPTDGLVVTDADSSGALYNYLFVKAEGSLGVHNTEYAVGLLQSSIDFLNPVGRAGAGRMRISAISTH